MPNNMLMGTIWAQFKHIWYYIYSLEIDFILETDDISNSDGKTTFWEGVRLSSGVGIRLMLSLTPSGVISRRPGGRSPLDARVPARSLSVFEDLSSVSAVPLSSPMP